MRIDGSERGVTTAMRMRLGVFALALLALAGCVSSLEQPVVRLEGARVASLGLSGGVLDVRLSVYNPNRFALRADGLTYDLDFEDPANGEWLDFAEGRVEERLSVEADDTAEVVIPVEFTYRGLGDVVRALIERGSFDYRLSGVVALEGPIRRDIEYRHTGTVSPGGSGR